MSRICFTLFLLTAFCVCPPVPAQQAASPGPNFTQAQRFSSSYIRQRTYSTSVRPNWIGETDRFWYSYRTATGTHYYIVDPDVGTKKALFDHERLASQLSMEVKKPLDSLNLTLGKTELDDEGKTLTFEVEKLQFELELATGNLKNLGKAPKEEPRQSRRRPTRGGDDSEDGKDEKKDPRAHRQFSPDNTAYVFLEDHNLFFVEATDEVKAKVLEIDARLKKEEKEKEAKEKAGESENDEVEKVVDTKEKDGKEDTKKGDEEKKDGDKDDDDDEKKDTKPDDKDKKEEEDKVDERQAWADDVDESKALQLTDSGEEDYEFSSGGRFRPMEQEELDEARLDADAYLELLQSGEAFEPLDDDEEKKVKKEGEEGKDEEEEEEDTKARPRVSWAPDSSAFHVTRRDSRGVGELFLVNSLSTPRPTLETYDYPLPGEAKIGTRELHVFDRTRKTLFQIETKWIDESHQNLHWPRTPEPSTDEDAEDPTPEELAGSGDELRFVRRDRLLRNVELCSVDLRTGETSVILEEGFVGANIATQGLRYLKQRDEMIWWSERSGWGHFYLYASDGTFKNAITSGPYRSSRIVEVDQTKGLLYFRANGRETGENIYYEHLYRVFLDGTGLTLMDPGNATHRSVLSPTQRFSVDNCSRIDMAPVSRLCDGDGKEIMQLEEADLSRLYEAGWTMPETFRFKAADGVTDLYGNLWKPFDFDSSKSYPIIAEVYPGPQTEGVSHSFSSTNGRQQLAQVGFIVVQLGHRGGTPGRSKAYHSYGYYNLRDYGLADKKAGLEQLAERHSYIDIERVGLYGHSGGGFMTAAALLREPYNDFFKVGVSSSGNHDNNVYGRHWAERYHGLKEVEVKAKKKGKRQSETKDKQEEETAARQDEKKDTKDGKKKTEDEKQDEQEVTTKFEIDVPTNAELAANLKGNLLLVHGDMDNNVHPAGTMRLVDALIKANKRFDLLIIPGKRHGYGDSNAYFTQRKWEFFAEHLLGDHQGGADILRKQ